MKKEVFLAVSVGFILGLLITFGIWTANRNLRSGPQPEPTPTPVVAEATPTPSPAGAIPLTLTSPEDELLSTTNTVTVAGTTSPLLPVTIATELDQTLIVSDAKGAFTYTAKLEGGYNRITVTVTDAAGASVSKHLLVTYTTTAI